jgi:hypothetical protein
VKLANKQKRFQVFNLIALRVERRIEINQINRFIRDVLAKHLQIVVVVKLIQFSRDITPRSGRDKPRAIRKRQMSSDR